MYCRRLVDQTYNPFFRVPPVQHNQQNFTCADCRPHTDHFSLADITASLHKAKRLCNFTLPAFLFFRSLHISLPSACPFNPSPLRYVAFKKTLADAQTSLTSVCIPLFFTY